MYWHGAGFFMMQRGLTWHMLRDNRYAARAADDLTNGLGQLPDCERDSEWAAIFTVAAAGSYADAGDPERAVDEAGRVVTVYRMTCSTRLAASLRSTIASPPRPASAGSSSGAGSGSLTGRGPPRRRGRRPVDHHLRRRAGLIVYERERVIILRLV